MASFHPVEGASYLAGVVASYLEEDVVHPLEALVAFLPEEQVGLPFLKVLAFLVEGEYLPSVVEGVAFLYSSLLLMVGVPLVGHLQRVVEV